MSDSIKDKLKDDKVRFNTEYVAPTQTSRYTNFQRCAGESGLVRKIKDATIDYEGNAFKFQGNKNRAMIGGLATIIGTLLNPLVGIAAMTYTGTKAYQALKDYEKIANTGR